MKAAFLGTGLLGYPMAEALLREGHEITVYNRTKSKAEPLSSLGATVVDNPAEAISAAECSLLMFSDAAAVSEVLFSEDVEDVLPGRTIIQMGTISSEQTTAIGEKVRELGGGYLEAPVLGSIPQAQESKLIVMAGGERELFDKYSDLLSAFGPTPLYVGGLGSAAALKLALNQLIASLTSAFALSLGLVQKNGVDVDLFMNILRKSSLYAPTFDKKLSRMRKDDFTAPNFPVKHMLKDVRLIIEQAEKSGLETAAVKGAEKILLNAVDQGRAEEDYSALYRGVVG